MEPDKLGEEHFQLARRVRKILERCSEIQELAIVHHLDELSEEDMTTMSRAVKIRLFLTQPLHAAEKRDLPKPLEYMCRLKRLYEALRPL